MNLEVLFEKIRKEEVILWIGAGFSIYAGMPSGNVLRSLIFNELKKFDTDGTLEKYNEQPLKDVAEKFVRACGSKNELNKILLDAFQKKPDDTTFHDILSRLPYFQNIITTNYDSLIEDSFQNRCYVVNDSKKLPYIKNQVPTIIKLHGDLKSLDNIIITSSDYSKSDNFDNLIWNHVKSICTYKDILFLGYGYEDSNVWYLFDKIAKDLDGHKRNKFLIVPNLDKIDEANFIRQGINVFKLNGEEFIQKLEESIVNNILSDVRNGLTSVNTFFEFAKYRSLSASIKTIEDKIYVQEITNSKGEHDLKLNFTLDSEIAQNFLKFNRGETDDLEYRIPNNKFLELSIYNFGLKEFLNKDNIKEIIIQNIGEECVFSIEREGCDISIENVIAKRFTFEKKILFKMKIGDYTLNLIFKINNKKTAGNFELNSSDVVTNITENLKLFTIISDVNEKDPILFFYENKHIIKFGRFIGKNEYPLKNLKIIFEKLRVIEKAAKIKFKKIQLSKIKKNEFLMLDFFYKLITERFYVETNVDKTIPIDENIIEKMLSEAGVNNFNGENLIAVNDKPIYKLFSEKLVFNCLTVEVVEAFISKKENGKSLIKSKKGKFIFRLQEDSDFFKNKFPH